MTKQFGTGDKPWTDGELLFNGMVWASGTRMSEASQELMAIMRRPTKESDVVWDTFELVIPRARYTWSRKDGTSFPNLNLDPDNLCPEGSVTKKIEKKMYEAIERWRNEPKQFIFTP